MTAELQQIFHTCDATWPAARQIVQDGWTLREGQGGGKRVSAATANLPGTLPDIARAEAHMQAMGQSALFMIRPGDQTLDHRLDALGYCVVDPVNIYHMPVAGLLDVPIPRVTAFCIWEPLAIMQEIWAKGGIGPARLAVMERAALKTGILSRWNEQPAGAAFAAIHDAVAMVHAVEVLPHQRKQGVAGWMMRAAAKWADQHGAHSITVLCTKANTGANALYSGLGFRHVGHYHYRTKTLAKD